MKQNGVIRSRIDHLLLYIFSFEDLFLTNFRQPPLGKMCFVNEKGLETCFQAFNINVFSLSMLVTVSLPKEDPGGT